MPPLERALALAEVDDAAGPVAEDLELDVPRLREVLLEVDAPVAESALGLRGRELEGGRELLVGARDAHAAAAASGHRLQEDGIADALREVHRVLDRVERAGAAGNRRHAHLPDGRLRDGLVAHPPDRVRRRADPLQPDLLEDLREVRVLREEAVAGMHGVGARDLRGRDERRDVQVRARRRGGTDAHRFVGGAHVKRVAVRLRVDRHASRSTAPCTPR